MRVKNQEEEETCKRVLIVAESDPSGGAGIQGDIKTVLALGGFAATAITSLASNHEQGNLTSICVSPSFIKDQMHEAMNGAAVDSIKVGFLESEDAINAVADVLDERRARDIPVVIDPSILSRSGKTLTDDKAIAAWKRRLYIHAKILTPNTKEAELLGVMKIADIDDMRHAADMMRTLGVENVVLKGGQAESGKELYFVASDHEERIYQRPTLVTPHTLGAGGAFSAALAVNLAKRMDIFDAVEHALDFMHQAILNSTGFGQAAGPINHAFDIQRRPSVFHPEEIKIYKI